MSIQRRCIVNPLYTGPDKAFYMWEECIHCRIERAEAIRDEHTRKEFLEPLFDELTKGTDWRPGLMPIPDVIFGWSDS